MKKKSISILVGVSLILFSCTLSPNTKSTGVLNLDKRHQILKIGVTNKNDTIGYLGEAILKEYPGESNWAYIETSEVKNFFGKTKIVKNNVLLLGFNNRGVLQSKEILTINDIKNLKLDQETTITRSVESTFSKNLFGSMRKRFQKKREEINP